MAHASMSHYESKITAWAQEGAAWLVEDQDMVDI